MARVRSVRPEYFTDDDIASLPVLARLLFVGLWCHADREGRLKDRPQALKARILPFDSCDVDDLLGGLVAVGQIVRYEVNGEKLIAIPKFLKHQHPHFKEPPSSLPPCNEIVTKPGMEIASCQDGNRSMKPGSWSLVLGPDPDPGAEGVARAHEADRIPPPGMDADLDTVLGQHLSGYHLDVFLRVVRRHPNPEGQERGAIDFKHLRLTMADCVAFDKNHLAWVESGHWDRRAPALHFYIADGTWRAPPGPLPGRAPPVDPLAEKVAQLRAEAQKEIDGRENETQEGRDTGGIGATG